MRPDSLTPRRLPQAMRAMKASAIGTRHGVGAGHRRVEGGDAGRHRHRHREHVVGEQGDAGHLRRQQAEVVLGDDVGAAGRRVGLDRLAVAEQQDGQHDDHGHRDRDDVAEGEDADARLDAASSGSPRWRRRSTTARRRRTRPARSGGRAARGPAPRSGGPGRGTGPSSAPTATGTVERPSGVAGRGRRSSGTPLAGAGRRPGRAHPGGARSVCTSATARSCAGDHDRTVTGPPAASDPPYPPWRCACSSWRTTRAWSTCSAGRSSARPTPSTSWGRATRRCGRPASTPTTPSCSTS